MPRQRKPLETSGDFAERVFSRDQVRSGWSYLCLAPGVQRVVHRQFSGQLRLVVIEDLAKALGDGYQSGGLGCQVGPLCVSASHDSRKQLKRWLISVKLVLVHDGVE